MLRRDSSISYTHTCFCVCLCKCGWLCAFVCHVSWLGGWSRQLLAWYMIPCELKAYQREAGEFMCWVPPSSESGLVPPCSSTLFHSASKMGQCSATHVGRRLIYACTHTHPPTIRHMCYHELSVPASLRLVPEYQCMQSTHQCELLLFTPIKGLKGSCKCKISNDNVYVKIYQAEATEMTVQCGLILIRVIKVKYTIRKN